MGIDPWKIGFDHQKMGIILWKIWIWSLNIRIEARKWGLKQDKCEHLLINMFFGFSPRGIILKVVRKETWKWLDGWFNVNTSRTSLLAQPAKSYPFGHISKFEKDKHCVIQHFPRHIYAGSSNVFLSCWKNIFWEVDTFHNYLGDGREIYRFRKDGWQDDSWNLIWGHNTNGALVDEESLNPWWESHDRIAWWGAFAWSVRQCGSIHLCLG